MTIGKVIGIYIARNKGDQTLFVNHAHVIPGLGIEGDRYFYQSSEADSKSKPGQELTLIEIESLEYISNNDGIQLTPDQSRRNIITRGIALNDLVGQFFCIGDVKLRGVRLCEPCQYLANRTDPRILPALLHRGGLRADILTDGMIHLNDNITISK